LSLGLNKKRLAQFALLAFVGGELSYAAAEVLVLRSVGPSASRYRAGQRLPDSTTFVLRPGDSVAVLAGGGTRTFRGPGSFTATGPARATGLASAGRRVNTGAVRGTGDGKVQRPSDIWALDVTQSGPICVGSDGRPVLWRPSAEQAVQLTITPPTGAPRTVSWPRGQQTLAWPVNVPLTNGASYQLSWSGATVPTRVTARTLAPLAANDLEGVATALITNQCRNQLEVLIAQREVKEPGTTPSGGTQ
jgi:hypothetical protein